MSGKKITKIMKYELVYIDGLGSFHDAQQELWRLQRQTREILNKSIQIMFHWDYLSRDNFERNGEYLDLKKETSYKRIDGYVYSLLKDKYQDLLAINLNDTIQIAYAKYSSSKKEVMRGDMSIPSYKKDQPLILHKDSIQLIEADSHVNAEIKLYSQKYNKSNELTSPPCFRVCVKDGTQRSILERVMNGEYTIGRSQIIYRNRKWFLYLAYTFTASQNELNPEKILGVDLGETYAIYASSVDVFGSFKIEGGEVTAYAKKLDARRHSLQKQAAICGEGRIGHGTRSRVSQVYASRDKLAHFRDTVNHRYSRALIDYAVKNGYGIIQMEDLSGIKEDTGFPKKLQHWTYYDLQSKIEYKAKECGISIVKISPKYTSQRCSKCGNIDPQNRKTQSEFFCTKCGYKCNADFNASQNISIKNIDKIIAKEVSANL